ncbi:hypothetical protein UFOVP898_20 [uncultured Caudovirales phage]|uniref:Uncharacterized protein n=1 Tax=uncultured Caudovirales phage TaxID=2100421 RepID=A0A6J5PGV7_9CAUD|nr:hypothetical protein UFOVP898_20 [uncultured Caudovirales phage]CAB4176549.1 hypothetical protein UFOVP985_39 [uncultured Caudovirales phage]CAB4181235.1 hypothetical protein UFOVP1073_18 [uncultured Caudovirales phage]CAB4198206.1 hypothetical protein UFOVP1308_57 [uncultured Caudovirales phage]CAB4210361.1 hypothetical protein UFOVP1423_12 [uncultured Caudovirales phage]
MRTMKINATTLLVLVVVFLVGWQMAGPSTPLPPGPLVNRPVLRWITRTAKSLLWVMAFAESKPKEREGYEESIRLVDANSGDEGRKINWSEGY